MLDITKIEEISSTLIFHENHKELIAMETFLKWELNKADDVMEQEHVLFLYLVVKIKNNAVETDSISTYFTEYFQLIKKTNKELNINKELKEIYLSNVVSHLQYLKKLYLDKYYGNTEEKIYILKNDIKRDLFYLKWEYYSFFRQSLYKYVLWYGRSYFNLVYTSTVNWFSFAFIFFIHDISTGTGSMYSSFTWIETDLVWGFDYYLYLSLCTLSNLWADFSLWTTPFLRLMFWIEQMTWVILTWLFVYILGKKI